MVRYLIFMVMLCVTNFVFGQKSQADKGPPKPLTRKQMIEGARNENCVKKINRTFTERLKNYPFSFAAQIQLVSFIGSDTSKVDNMRDDTLPRLNDTICYSKLSEIKTLTFAQVDKLTDILYNYGFGGPTYIGSISQCFNPRNAILFLDKKGKAFEFIEICFQCSRAEGSSEKIELGQMCYQKMDMLKAFFKTIGIKYGVTKGLVPGDWPD